MKTTKLSPTIKPEGVIWYFTHEIDGLRATDLACTISGDEVTLRPVHWLDDAWTEVMDYVESMDGEWVKDGKNSHWIFDVDRIDYRIEEERWLEENRPLMEWWIQQPDAVKTELIPLYKDTARWRAMTRDERAAMVGEARARAA